MCRFRRWWRRGAKNCHGTLASPFESPSSGGILRCPEFGACGSGARKVRSRVARPGGSGSSAAAVERGGFVRLHIEDGEKARDMKDVVNSFPEINKFQLA